MNSNENGGLNFLDFATLNNIFKINLIRQLKCSVSIFIPLHILYSLGGINFFLICNFDINKIPVKLFAFHRKAFLAWSLIYKKLFTS